MNQPSSNRFIAHQTGLNVALHGSITDTTTFEALNKLIVDGTTLDCQQLGPCSWIGLVALVDYLRTQKIPNIILKNIPSNLYRYIKLVPDLAEVVQVSSFFYAVSPQKGEPEVDSAWNQEEHGKQEHDYLPTNDGTVVGELARFALVSQFPMPTIPPASVVTGKADEVQIDSFYWYRYSQFVTDTLGLTVLLTDSVLIGLLGIFMRLDARISTIEKCFKELSTPVTMTHYDFQSLSKFADDSIKPCTKQMNETLKSMRTENFEWLRSLKTGDTTENLTAENENLAKSTKTLQETAITLESIGTTIGDKVLSVTASNELTALVENIMKVPLPAEDLTKIRDAFLIVDVMSDGDQDLSREEIMTEIKQISGEIDRCIVQLQGFDLARQMLEHRLGEIALIEQPQWEVPFRVHCVELKTELIALIKKKMVTDQEKAVFKFYFPEEQTVTNSDANLEAGDVMLF